MFAAYERAYERAWRCFDDVAEALSKLHGQRLAVLTNGEAAQQRRKLAATSIGHFFEAVVASSELGVAKPQAEAFHRACEKIGVRPNECWYVGDNLDGDAVASARAGLRGVWLNREHLARVDPLPPGVDVLVSLKDLPALLGSERRGLTSTESTAPSLHAPWICFGHVEEWYMSKPPLGVGPIATAATCDLTPSFIISLK